MPAKGFVSAPAEGEARLAAFDSSGFGLKDMGVGSTFFFYASVILENS